MFLSLENYIVFSCLATLQASRTSWGVQYSYSYSLLQVSMSRFEPENFNLPILCRKNFRKFGPTLKNILIFRAINLQMLSYFIIKLEFFKQKSSLLPQTLQRSNVDNSYSPQKPFTTNSTKQQKKNNHKNPKYDDVKKLIFFSRQFFINKIFILKKYFLATFVHFIAS